MENHEWSILHDTTFMNLTKNNSSTIKLLQLKQIFLNNDYKKKNKKLRNKIQLQGGKEKPLR